MKETYRNEKIYFRIVGMQENYLSELKEILVNHNVKTAKYKIANTLVASFELLQDCDYKELNEFLVSKTISEDSYGMYISLVTERDNDGVHLPDYALNFFKMIGGNIDFSFTCTGSQADE